MRAYYAALGRRKLAPIAALSRARLRDELAAIERKLAAGRRDEAIGDLVYVVESPRFDAFARSEEGRAMVFWLGDALGRAGAHEPARGYLGRLLRGRPDDTWARRAARSLVDFGLDSDDAAPFLGDLAAVPPSAPAEVRGDVAYLRGRWLEQAGRPAAALAEYAKVTPRSRFWAQATYLAGLLEVQRGRLRAGERQFCKIADPKQTPREAPLFGHGEFFRVRDLARLALGRVAHEQLRHDDARYYYYTVPADSEHLPEALYESATTRYEKKDYAGARELMDELRAHRGHHPYQDEAWVLDAFLDLATCQFPQAERKLATFLRKYTPIRDAARRIAKDRTAVVRLAEAVRTSADPSAAGLGLDAEVARTLAVLLRVDAGYARASERVARLEHQARGLLGAIAELDEVTRRLAAPRELRPQSSSADAGATERVERMEAQLAEVRRLLREAERAGKKARGGKDLAELERQLDELEVRVRAARTSLAPAGATGSSGDELAELVRKDRALATRLYAAAERIREEAVAQQAALARDALVRLDRRLTRLLARARLGKIEVVLGKKRSLELEVEALAQGLLPQSLVDSLDAERYLRDDEEYWPFDGEDWEDEYVGGEGLR
ncbi:MAG: hypothetical protein IT376_21695 [Polyangiaceae bacterium]|nr:hypothetical protein [Polyangiaceae bacterium]